MAQASDAGKADRDKDGPPTETMGDDDDDVVVDDSLPGDPPSSTAAIRVKINGVERSFDGPSTWTKWLVDGSMTEGFQTNGRSKNDWVLLLAINSTTPGEYTCETDSRGGLSLSRSNDDGSDRTTFGGYVGQEKCTITLTEHGSRKGDHVKGTFSGELTLTEGDHPKKKLVLTEGQFDLVQVADTPAD